MRLAILFAFFLTFLFEFSNFTECEKVLQMIVFGINRFGDGNFTAETPIVLVNYKPVFHVTAGTFNYFKQGDKIQRPRPKLSADGSIDLGLFLNENKTKVQVEENLRPSLNGCSSNPCMNNGTCMTCEEGYLCRCLLPFTGPTCNQTVCDLSPCLFGDCLLEGASYRCDCHAGYSGDKCDRRATPCMLDVLGDRCSGHGECVEVRDKYKCLCHAVWEGLRCERRMASIT